MQFKWKIHRTEKRLFICVLLLQGLIAVIKLEVTDLKELLQRGCLNGPTVAWWDHTAWVICPPISEIHNRLICSRGTDGIIASVKL